MRTAFLLLLSILVLSCRKMPAVTKSEYPECRDLALDLSDGTMNGVKPNQTQNEIREWIPCFNKLTPNGGDSDCGGGLFYDTYHFAFYTYFDKYLEVRNGFKGRGDTLFLKNRGQLRQLLGKPAETSISQEHPDKDFFTTDYGCIRIHYQNDMPVIIATHYRDCESLQWCEDRK